MCECVFIIMRVCVIMCVCVCLCLMTCVCVCVSFFDLLQLACRLSQSGRMGHCLLCVCNGCTWAKKRKRANIDQIMCRYCVCVLWLVACIRVFEFLYICERVVRWHSSLAFIQRITLHTLCEAATIDIPMEVGVWGKKHCFWPCHLISKLLYSSLCLNELRLDDQDKEPLIATKII